MNSASNGIMLPSTPNEWMTTHNGFHSQYNNAVANELNYIGGKYKDKDSRRTAVQHLQRSLDSALRKNKIPLNKERCGQPTGLTDGAWEKYIKSSRRY